MSSRSKQITCAVIDNPPPDWGVWREVPERTRYKEFQGNFPDNVYFCKDVLSGKPNFDTIQIIGRIGSISADGEVYRIKMDKMDFAMKIMPHIDGRSLSQNNIEITTAHKASEYPECFPMTFAHGYCDDASYYIAANNTFSHFIPAALEYSQMNKLERMLPSRNIKTRFTAERRNGMSFEDLKKKYSLKYEGKGIQVDFLISELANGDLGNWMSVKRDVKDWQKILKDILNGIYHLTIFMRKIHTDLHVGNVLIVEDNKALIHDFGRCLNIIDETNISYRATLISFCSEFISCSTRADLFVPKEILLKLQKIDSINRSIDFDLINPGSLTSPNGMKRIYEEIFFPIIDQ